MEVLRGSQHEGQSEQWQCSCHNEEESRETDREYDIIEKKPYIN